MRPAGAVDRAEGSGGRSAVTGGKEEMEQELDSRVFAAVMGLGRADRVGSPGRGGASPVPWVSPCCDEGGLAHVRKR